MNWLNTTTYIIFEICLVSLQARPVVNIGLTNTLFGWSEPHDDCESDNNHDRSVRQDLEFRQTKTFDVPFGEFFNTKYKYMN